MPPRLAAVTPRTPATSTPGSAPSRRRCATGSSALPISKWRPSWPPLLSGEGDVLIAQRHRTNPFAGGRQVRVDPRRRRNADGRLADPAPEAAARHDDRLDLRHLVDPHRIVG